MRNFKFSSNNWILRNQFVVVSSSVHQDIFQEKNEEGKFPGKNSRQQVKVIIMNLRLSSVTRGLEGYLSRVHWGCGYC